MEALELARIRCARIEVRMDPEQAVTLMREIQAPLKSNIADGPGEGGEENVGRGKTGDASERRYGDEQGLDDGRDGKGGEHFR